MANLIFEMRLLRITVPGEIVAAKLVIIFDLIIQFNIYAAFYLFGLQLL